MTLFTKSLSVCAGALLATGILFTGFCSADEEHIAVVERPSTKVANVNYTASRAPLKPLQFIKLPVREYSTRRMAEKIPGIAERRADRTFGRNQCLAGKKR